MTKKQILKITGDYREYAIKSLRNPTEAKEYLKAAMEDYEENNHIEIFLLALRTVVEAYGGITELSKKTDLNRQNLYRALSEGGNPRLNTLDLILRVLGFRLSIEKRDN